MSLKRIKNAGNFLTIYLQKELRKLRGLPIIHVIGDSHSLLFQSPLFSIHYIGPATAFNLCSDTSTTRSKQQIYAILSKLPKGSFVLLVFGEIDCRIHIYDKCMQKKIAMDDLITKTVDAYGVFIQEMQEKFPYITFITFNILPPGEQGNMYNIKHYASREMRFDITKLMNEKLREFCEAKNVLFIDIFDNVISGKERIPSYVFDDVHYNSKIVKFIKQQLEEQKLI